MTKVQKSPFQFLNYFIQESNIVRKPVEKKYDFSLSVTPYGFIDKNNNIFQLDLITEVSEKNERFKCKVHCVGFFKFKDLINKSDISNYFYINSPAILYPYIRAYVAALTSLSGLETIHLPTLNLTEIGKELEKHTKEINSTN